MDKVLSTVSDVAGDVLSILFGGWSEALTTLLIFMVVDCFSRLVVAGIYKKSPTTDNGSLEFHAGIKCFFRKVGTLALVIIAYRVDVLLNIGGNFTRNAVAIVLCVNESISIIENLGQMGLKIPAPLSRSINLLKNTNKDKSNNSNDSKDDNG